MMFVHRHRSLLLRIGLSAALIAFILTSVELARVVDILSGVRPEFLILALGIIFLERVVLAYKWNVLLAAKGMHQPLLRLVKICYTTGFIGSFLPSSLGVDMLRSYSLYRHGTELKESISSVVADKVLSILMALVLPVATALFFPDVFPGDAIRWAVLCTAAVLIASMVCVLSRRLAGFGIALSKKISQRLAEKAWMLHDSVRDYLGHRKAVWSVLLLSFVFQILRVSGVYAIGVSMLPEFSFLHCLAFVPVIVILMLLPVSVAGFGVREGGFVFFFSQVGIPVSDAFALSVLVYVVGIIAILPGGIIYAREGMASTKAHGESAGITSGKL